MGGILIITKDDKQEYYYDVIAFEDSSSSSDNIHVKRGYWGWDAYDSLFNTNGVDKNPDVSCGVWELYGYNVWVVWQTNQGGRWHLVGSYTTIFTWGVEDENTPKLFKLYQNYPNPFNPTTKIRHVLNKNTKVKLCIYNTLGQKLATLVDAEQQAGTYEAVWDASKFSSGVYYAKLETSDYLEARKLILMK
ncbi:MAG: T9SS type A sorting domain-containing protein [Bacteroidota bacterium]|nr:T9SS type A sorting domain-containing protein [Bacteroidota bacterium]